MNAVTELKPSKIQVQTLAKNLRSLLNARNISENEIAQSLDIPVMTIRRIVSGETADPRISTLKLIADYFDVSIDALMGNNEKSINLMTKKMPQFVPILDWEIAGNINSTKEINLINWKQWQPIVFGDNASLSENSFALESRPSMQPRFPKGTLFIIDPNETATDGDIVLIKIKNSKDLSLRELIIDPPRWQLQSIVTGSEVLFYDSSLHNIMGVVVLNMLHTRKEK